MDIDFLEGLGFVQPAKNTSLICLNQDLQDFRIQTKKMANEQLVSHFFSTIIEVF